MEEIINVIYYLELQLDVPLHLIGQLNTFKF